MLPLVASRATCSRRAVAAIITTYWGQVLGTGYNGVPRDIPHCIDFPCAGANDLPGDTRRCLAVHAEQNAIIQCIDLERAYTIYTSTFPCFACAKLIVNTSIQRVVYVERYADEMGFELFTRVGIKFFQYDTTEPLVDDPPRHGMEGSRNLTLVETDRPPKR